MLSHKMAHGGRLIATCIYNTQRIVNYANVSRTTTTKNSKYSFREQPHVRLVSTRRAQNPDESVRQTENGYEIVWQSSSIHSSSQSSEAPVDPLFVDYMWLRDHCRCSKCYNWQTFQRQSGPQHIQENIRPISWTLDAEHNLRVKWPDHHESTFSVKWLKENVHHKEAFQNKPSVHHWDSSLRSKDYPNVKYIDDSDSNQFAQQVLSNLITFGFCLVHDVVPELEQCRIVGNKIANILNGFWGEVTMLNSKSDSEQVDTAFSNVSLPPHTDGTYFTESPGLQLFYGIEEATTGGETILVDGFYAAHRLMTNHPDAYEHLLKTPIESTYTDHKGNFFSHYDTVLKHVPCTSKLLQIRFNPLDVAPLKCIPQHDIRNHYRAYSLLCNEINDPNSEIKFTLKPGTMIVLDNWRVLHGRTAFRGNRTLAVCYIGRTEFYSKARRLGLI